MLTKRIIVAVASLAFVAMATATTLGVADSLADWVNVPAIADNCAGAGGGC